LNDKEFHALEAKKRGANIAQVYKNVPKVFKFFRRIQILLNLPYIELWLSSWKKFISDYEVIILHASKITPPVARYIRKKYPDKRIIIWYWNPMKKCVDAKKFIKYNCEIWTFDEKDREQYLFNYNTQYYFSNVDVVPMESNSIDIFFVGKDKGRIKQLVDLKNKFDSYKLESKFHITKVRKKAKGYEKWYKNRMPYYEVLQHISKSKAILDYVSDNQSGLTLRPLEALFFKKKLITNDKSIVNRDFYRKENIFIIGRDEFNELPSFVSSPYLEINRKIVQKYEFEDWLNRFFETTENKELL
jgi:hypothetical protein